MSIGQKKICKALAVLSIFGVSTIVFAAERFYISTCEELQNIDITFEKGNEYVQTNDIDCAGIYFKPIGDLAYRRFSAIYDGRKHEIKNLTITGGHITGLFAGTMNATIKNVGLVGYNISGSSMAGALIGDAVNTKVSQSYAKDGIVSATDVAAGLIGSMDMYTEINDSYAGGEIYAKSAAGLVSSASYYSAINRSFAYGKVKGTQKSAGLILSKEWDASVNASYWDTQTTGQTQSAGGGVGRTTDQMQLLDVSKPVYEGWDESIWYFREGYYPGLY